MITNERYKRKQRCARSSWVWLCRSHTAMGRYTTIALASAACTGTQKRSTNSSTITICGREAGEGHQSMRLDQRILQAEPRDKGGPWSPWRAQAAGGT